MKVFTCIVISLLFCQKATAEDQSAKKCNINEKYSVCGTACPLTCDNYKNPPTSCTRQCVQGCFCEDGYVRNSDGVCVQPEKCKQKDPTCSRKHEKYNECGTACIETCDNYKNPPPFCTEQCVKGCFCKSGFVRNSDGDCVQPKKCKPKVPNCSRKHEHYNECGSACPITCENHLKPPTFCTLQCVPGCQCKKGYLRSETGDCVLPRNCPKTPRCPKHEAYNECGTACPLTCKNYLKPPTGCTKQCVSECQCEEGYVRNDTGECVRPCDCPKTPRCPKHEVYNKCGTACPLTCKNHRNPPTVCTKNCKIGCECKPGYVRNENDGKCVSPCHC